MNIQFIPEHDSCFINLAIKRIKHRNGKEGRRCVCYGHPSKLYPTDWSASTIAEYYIRECLSHIKEHKFIVSPYALGEDGFTYHIQIEIRPEMKNNC